MMSRSAYAWPSSISAGCDRVAGGRKGQLVSESRDLDLTAARQRLAAAFAAYPARHPVEGCPCCVTSEDQQALAGGDLGRFSAKALTTWGDVEDFKHFLPRLLDHDLDQALHKLAYADWRQWPQPEQRAVEEYLVALWEEQQAVGEEYPPAADLLHAMGELGIDLRPHLDRWRRCGSNADVYQLVTLINNDLRSSLHPTIYQLPKQPRSAPAQTLLEWLLEPETSQMLEAAFFAASGAEAAEISRAVDRLALLAQIYR
jgi:hypothetical protein